MSIPKWFVRSCFALVAAAGIAFGAGEWAAEIGNVDQPAWLPFPSGPVIVAVSVMLLLVVVILAVHSDACPEPPC